MEEARGRASAPPFAWRESRVRPPVGSVFALWPGDVYTYRVTGHIGPGRRIRYKLHGRAWGPTVLETEHEDTWQSEWAVQVDATEDPNVG
jgi:hypothetical protein